MAATLIDGRAVAQRVRAQAADDVAAFTAETGVTPGLATVLVGDDPASVVYVANKRRMSVAAGIADLHRHLPADVSQAEVVAHLQELNADPDVSGILLQLPVPDQLDAHPLVELISPNKDVDGLTAVSAGRLAQGVPGLRPATPSGVMELLDRYEVALEGAEAVIVGRSDLVGKPLIHLLLQRNATVTVCHSRTRDLQAVTRRADVLIAAVGVPRLIGADAVKPGATVIDVGVNRLEEGLVGDVDFDAVREVAGLITPVPGGVGPMTIAMLLRNTLTAAQLQRGV
ncbi:MAG TPA: bifunctional methylenetetrahydrofolate dehydrogenase/methenyltetrahydrofolate cyclohydrolase FolD [Conexibacter sp.]|jgi:methylenetetrahydrofolate dehydrogenase (NADP+)/methenyltetrahydrofolate cyclohydrolase